ncbi:hypothetical protein LCGC14_0044880 [marine sediment metagenome]|uniref:Uncharacterized protein n=2 Tax=root TaxID=1 RepID=A0A7V1BHX3_9RHOB|nr:hypothetical protein [Sulfitobacter litoralis]HDZ53532.1 hypothetical protein [Sulfitobacter litoralis]
MMQLSKKHYSPGKRTLDDFADTIICRSTSSGRAVLDTGFYDSVSDPDFAPSGYGDSFDTAAKNCGARIREAAQDGKRYDCLHGYTLQYRLMYHWDRKEKFVELGLDPNEVMKDCNDSFGQWPLGASWLQNVKGARHAEFFFKLLVATGQKGIEDGVYDRLSAIDAIMVELADEFPQIGQSIHHPNIPRPRSETELRDIVLERLHEIFDGPDVSIEDSDDIEMAGP